MRNDNAYGLNAARLKEYITIETKTWHKSLLYDLYITKKAFQSGGHVGAVLTTIVWLLDWLFLFYAEFANDSLWGGFIGPAFYTGGILLLYLATPDGSLAKAYSRALSFISVILLILIAVLHTWL
jgi:hypothetical protein